MPGYGSGLAAQLMFAEEATYGTFQTPVKGIDLVSEGIKNTIQRIESKGLRAGRRVQQSNQWLPGKRNSAGPLELEVATNNFGLLFKHALGAIATTTPTAGVFNHTATPGNIAGLGLTMQLGRPSTDGTVRPYTYTGCKIPAWELSCKAGELLKMKVDVWGQDETSAQALATFPALPTTYEPLSFIGATIQVGGTQVDVKDFTLKGDNKLNLQRWMLRGGGTAKEPLPSDFAEFTGSLVADFTDLTLYGDYVNASEFAVVATFAGPVIASTYNYEVVLTLHARADGDTPHVAGPAILEQPLSFKCIAPVGQADSGAISLLYQTNDATP